jgi:hypothetical protein
MTARCQQPVLCTEPVLAVRVHQSPRGSSLFCGWSTTNNEHNVAMNFPSPPSCQPQTIEEIRWQRNCATKVKQFQNMNLPKQAEKSGKMLTILQNKDQSAERLVTKKRVSFNLEANVTMFYNIDPRSTRMGLAKWTSQRKDLSRWGATPTDKGLPLPGRNCNIHFKTDPREKSKNNKKRVHFNLDANVTMCYNNDPRNTKMGLAKWSSKRKDLSRWGDDTTETKEVSCSVPSLPRRASGKDLLGKTLNNSIEGGSPCRGRFRSRDSSIVIRFEERLPVLRF